MPWEIETKYLHERQIKRYAKHHRAEFVSCVDRLEHYIEKLNEGFPVNELQPGYLHQEGGHLFAIGNARTPSARESRLYFYCDPDRMVLYLLGIGDKDHQRNDISQHRKTITQIRRENKR